MLSAFTPEIEQQLLELQQRSIHSSDFWDALEVPQNPYLHYIWLQQNAGKLQAAELWQAAVAMSDSDTAEEVKRAARSPLAECLRRARRLQIQQVPRIVEFMHHRLAQEILKDQLYNLLHQVNEADAQDIDFMFARIADLLLNHFLLCVGKQRYRLRDIEFYFLHPGVHDDHYAHREDEQQQIGHWYYNKVGGLDLTFGLQELGTWGGILLRGVERVPPAPDEAGHVKPTKIGYISGPQLVLRDIIASLNDLFGQPQGIMLDEIHSASSQVAWRVRRLNLTHEQETDPKRDFLNRRYRFLTDPKYMGSLKDRADVVRQLQLPPAEAKEILGYTPRI